MEKQGRIEWIDICKAIAIFFMVFLHVGMETPYKCSGLDTFVHYWHMPIFFILSGLVFKPSKYGGWNNFGKLVWSRVKALLIPMLAFGVICLIYNKMFIFPNGAPTKNGTLVQCLLWPNIYLHMYELQWFLMCLFMTEILFAVLYNAADGKNWLVIVLTSAFLVGGHILIQGVGRLPLTLNSTVYTIPIFAIGVLGKKAFMEWRPFRNKAVQVLVLMVLIGLAFFKPGELNIRKCLFDPVWMYFFGILLTAIVIWFIKEQEWWITKLPFYNKIKWLGRNTLAILVLNGSLRKTFPWGNLMVSDNPLLVFAVQFAASMIIIYLIYFITLFVEKYCPWILGKTKSAK